MHITQKQVKSLARLLSKSSGLSETIPHMQALDSIAEALSGQKWNVLKTSLPSGCKSKKSSEMVVSPDIGALFAVDTHDRLRVIEETISVYGQPKLKVIIPLTEFSARFFGRLWPKWDGSSLRYPNFIIRLVAKNNNVETLYIYSSQREKSNRIYHEFRNWENEEVTSDYVRENWDLLKHIVAFIGRLKYYPPEYLTYDICSKAYGSLESIPIAFRDRKMCLESVRKSGMNLEHVPEHLRDREMCLTAIKHNIFHSALQFVPLLLRDKQMCLSALKTSSQAFRYIPREICDRDIYLALVKANGLALKHVPLNMRDREIYFEAIVSMGIDKNLMETIPESLLDRRFFLDVVKRNGFRLNIVPLGFVDLEMCQAAVASEPRSIKSVPPALLLKLDKETVLDAVINHDIDQHKVPKEWWTPEMIGKLSAISKEDSGKTIIQDIETYPKARELMEQCFYR